MDNNDYVIDSSGRKHKRFFTDTGHEIIKHDDTSGCLLVLKRRELKTPSTQGSVGHLLKYFYCLTHNVEVCKCGIPYGRHEEYADQKQKEHSTIPVQDGEPIEQEVSFYDEQQAYFSE